MRYLYPGIFVLLLVSIIGCNRETPTPHKNATSLKYDDTIILSNWDNYTEYIFPQDFDNFQGLELFSLEGVPKEFRVEVDSYNINKYGLILKFYSLYTPAGSYDVHLVTQMKDEEKKERHVLLQVNTISDSAFNQKLMRSLKDQKLTSLDSNDKRDIKVVLYTKKAVDSSKYVYLVGLPLDPIGPFAIWTNYPFPDTGQRVSLYMITDYVNKRLTIDKQVAVGKNGAPLYEIEGGGYIDFENSYFQVDYKAKNLKYNSVSNFRWEGGLLMYW